MHWSDLNILVTFRARSLTEGDIFKQVERFNEFLKTRTSVVRSEFAERKNITLMRLWVNERFSGKRVEIIFRRFMIQSIPKNESIVVDYLKDYPISRMLYFLVRRLFHASGLDDPLDGGINSFSIFLLIIAFLQMIESSNLKSSEKKGDKMIDSNLSLLSTKYDEVDGSAFDIHLDESNLNKYINNGKVGEIFLNMVYFYGYSFDYGKNYINTYVSRNSKCHPFFIKADSALSSLMILNPFDSNLIITKSFKKTSILKQHFKLVYNNTFSVCMCESFGFEGLSKVARLPKTNLVVNLFEVPPFPKFHSFSFSFVFSLQQQLSKNPPVVVKNTQTDLCEKGNDIKKNSFRSRLRANSSVFNNFKNEVFIEGMRKNEFGYKIQALLAFNFCY